MANLDLGRNRPALPPTKRGRFGRDIPVAPPTQAPADPILELKSPVTAPDRVVDLESFNQLLASNPTPERRTDALIELRAAMEAGDVRVKDYLDAGKRVGKLLGKDFANLPNSPRGSALARQFQGGTGFLFQGNAHLGNVELQTEEFGADFQKRFREEILPPGLTPEQREKFLNDIPLDIPIESDRFSSEREGIRQRLQQEGAQEVAVEKRSERLTDLATLLGQQADRQFTQDIPGLAESAQARGQLDSSAFGADLARRRSDLANRTTEALALQGLSDRDAEILGQLQASNTQRGFQTAGLQRDFGLSDDASNFARQLDIARLTTPQFGGGGKSGGEKAAQGVTAGASLIGAFRG